jgi:hypothetical protein
MVKEREGFSKASLPAEPPPLVDKVWEFPLET